MGLSLPSRAEQTTTEGDENEITRSGSARGSQERLRTEQGLKEGTSKRHDHAPQSHKRMIGHWT